MQPTPPAHHHHHTNMSSCLSSGPTADELGAAGAAGLDKGDFVLQTGHIIEIITKLFLVVQNATGRPPAVNIATEFEACFGADNRVGFAFKLASAGHGVPPGMVKLVKKGNKFEVLV